MAKITLELDSGHKSEIEFDQTFYAEKSKMSDQAWAEFITTIQEELAFDEVQKNG